MNRNNALVNKYVSRRRLSLEEDYGDDDDMREELDRLDMAQAELQRELLNIMKTVEIMHAIGKDGLEEGRSSDLFGVGSTHSSNTRWSDYQDSSTQLEVEVEEELGGGTKKAKPFSKGFFELIKPKESLESQKKRQMEIVKENLHSIEPGLEKIADCQRQTQETIVKKRIQLEELRVKNHAKLERLLKSQPKTLEEEKERQRQILELSLDPDLVQKLEKEQEVQGKILERKQKELEATKLLMREKMQELALSKKKKQLEKEEGEEERFWTAPRKRFEAMLFRKKTDQIERSQRHISTFVR